MTRKCNIDCCWYFDRRLKGIERGEGYILERGEREGVCEEKVR